jgi:hypothetical protein
MAVSRRAPSGGKPGVASRAASACKAIIVMWCATTRFSPMDAGLAIQATRNLAAEHIGPWAGLGILSLYAAAAVIAGLIVFQLRDAH